MNPLDRDPARGRQPGVQRAPGAIGPLYLTTAFLVLATLSFALIRSIQERDTPAPGLRAPQPADFTQVPERTFVPPLERSPGPPVSAPELPGELASKADLWSYGARYLGWQDIAEVDLESYTAADLRSWLAEDQSLYVRAEQPESETQELSVVGNQE